VKYQVTVGAETFQVGVEGDVVTVDGTAYEAELRVVEGTPMRLLLLDHGSWVLPINPAPGRSTWEVFDGGERFEALVLDERTAHIRSLVGVGAAPAGSTVLKAPMPGLVTKVSVEPGQAVVAGASLVTLEAMKMENDLRATGSGTVDRVAVAAGETVEKGAILITFGPA